MLRSRAEIIPVVLSIAAGIAGWEAVRYVSGHGEAWDDPSYWQTAYPLLLLTSFLLGMIWREAPWRWVALIFGAQALWSFGLAAVDAEVPSLFPLGLLLFALISVPCLTAAYLGKWLAGRAPA